MPPSKKRVALKDVTNEKPVPVAASKKKGGGGEKSGASNAGGKENAPPAKTVASKKTNLKSKVPDHIAKAKNKKKQVKTPALVEDSDPDVPEAVNEVSIAHDDDGEGGTVEAPMEQ